MVNLKWVDFASWGVATGEYATNGATRIFFGHFVPSILALQRAAKKEESPSRLWIFYN